MYVFLQYILKRFCRICRLESQPHFPDKITGSFPLIEMCHSLDSTSDKPVVPRVASPLHQVVKVRYQSMSDRCIQTSPAIDKSPRRRCTYSLLIVLEHIRQDLLANIKLLLCVLYLPPEVECVRPMNYKIRANSSPRCLSLLSSWQSYLRLILSTGQMRGWMWIRISSRTRLYVRWLGHHFVLSEREEFEARFEDRILKYRGFMRWRPACWELYEWEWNGFFFMRGLIT